MNCNRCDKDGVLAAWWFVQAPSGQELHFCSRDCMTSFFRTDRRASADPPELIPVKPQPLPVVVRHLQSVVEGWLAHNDCEICRQWLAESRSAPARITDVMSTKGD